MYLMYSLVILCYCSIGTVIAEHHLGKLYHVNHTNEDLKTFKDLPPGSFHLNITYNLRSLRLRLYPPHHADSLYTPLISSHRHHSLLSGYVEGDPSSEVIGYFTRHGYFSGVVYTDNEIVHIEPSHRFGYTSSQNVIYHRSQVDYTQLYKHFKAASAPLPTPHASDDSLPDDNQPGGVTISRSLQHPPGARPKSSYSIDANSLNSPSVHYSKSKEKITRKSKRDLPKMKKKTCPVYLVADHLFFKKMGDSDEEKTRNELILHLHEADKIFRSTDFDNDAGNDNIGFSVANISILKKNTAENKFSDNIIGVKEFLDRWSEYNHDPYCLAVLFTYRDFDSGVLGLAWVASVDGAPGGICQKRQVIGGRDRNLNTAIVSLINFGRYVGHAVSFITVAHELGHNFGSSHDSDSAICSPGANRGGNYIMYARATDGNLPNNIEFSDCSKKAITAVLNTKSSACFEAETSFCGNKIKEWGEVCDCGNTDTCDLVDQCCVAKSDQTEGCKLRSSARYDFQCSGQQGPCCDGDWCKFRRALQQCEGEKECTNVSYCNGTASECPTAPHKPQHTMCNNGANTCYEGSCIGSVCQLVNLQECQCETDDLCTVCCLEGGKCTPTGSTLTPTNHTYLLSGRSCKNYQGYCNSDHQCIQVNLENPLSGLEDAFSKKNLGNALQWLRHHWYYTITIIACVALLCFLFKVTYRRSKPIQKYVQQMSQTLRRGHNGGARGYNYQQYVQPRSVPPGASSSSSQPHSAVSDADKEKLKRMCAMFPTASKSLLWSVRRKVDHEEAAVVSMLQLGYPLKPNSL